MRAGTSIASALLWAIVAASPASAQVQGSVFERLNLDRLRLSALGVSFGSVTPSRALRTKLYSIHADYGEITPNWRVVFSASFWGTRFRDDVVQTFVDSIRTIVNDPAGDDSLVRPRITESDIAILADVRYSPRRSSFLRPFIGGGIGAHVINAEGKPINGTFVESSLDNITAGVGAVVGIDAIPTRRLSIGVQARYDLISAARFGSIRVAGSYLLDPALRRGAPANSTGTPR